VKGCAIDSLPRKADERGKSKYHTQGKREWDGEDKRKGRESKKAGKKVRRKTANKLATHKNTPPPLHFRLPIPALRRK
jgi:hypothetical protein